MGRESKFTHGLTDAPDQEWNEVPRLATDDEEAMVDYRQEEEDGEYHRRRHGRGVVVKDELLSPVRHLFRGQGAVESGVPVQSNNGG